MNEDYTMEEIAEINSNNGGYFFSKNTMRFFGDNISCFEPVYIGDRIFIRRIKDAKNKPVSVPSQIGDMREFFPDTGRIGCILKPDQISSED